jgi:predicted RNA-binding protein with RPS1 domain
MRQGVKKEVRICGIKKYGAFRSMGWEAELKNS